MKKERDEVQFVLGGDTPVSGLTQSVCIFNRLEPLQSIQQQATLKIYKAVEEVVYSLN